tara:strand:- start:844 stop:1095 length:252 start_codon:yes stop_codon:yes gene_type:complete
MLEGEYLELTNQLKEKYDEVEQKLESIERREKEIRKDFISAYGIVRLLDHLIDMNPVGYDVEIVTLVECLRGFLSDAVDKHVF